MAQVQKVEMRAIRPLKGDYGHKQPGQRFQTDSKTALRLESRGAAERFYNPRPIQPPPEPKAISVYENKAIVPPLKKQAK